MADSETPFDLDGFLAQIMEPEPVIPTEEVFIQLCTVFQQACSMLPNLLVIHQPVTVVGAVHAQLDDIRELFDICGEVPFTSYLFLGDFVNYGEHNIATVCLLFALALKYPDHLHLIRGAHESRQLTLVCGLYEEVINKYGSPRAWEVLMDAFDYLPLAAHVCYQFFCVSGGIDKSIKQLSQINEFNRFVEVPQSDTWSSLVWSIPSETVSEFAKIPDHPGSYFGDVAVDAFLKANGLSAIIRSKNLRMNGYQNNFNDKVISVWSAPNFNGWVQNTAAVVQMIAPAQQFHQKGKKDNLFQITTFRARPDSCRITKTPLLFQDIHSLDHIYIKHLPKQQ